RPLTSRHTLFPYTTLFRSTDEQQQLAGAFGIRSIPTLVVFREKVILFQQAGALPGAALEQVITQAQALDMAKVHAEASAQPQQEDRKSTRLNSSHVKISYA